MHIRTGRLFLFPLLATYLLIAGCIAPIRGFYRGDDDDMITYFSKDKVPFLCDIPGVNWRVHQVNPHHVILIDAEKFRQTINIFEYNDGLLRQRFYKKGFTESQAIEEYYNQESTYQLADSDGTKRRIIRRDIEGPIIPNILWSIELPQRKMFFITMSRNQHLISISAENMDPPYGDEEFVLTLFRSIRLLTEQQVDMAITRRYHAGNYRSPSP